MRSRKPAHRHVGSLRLVQAGLLSNRRENVPDYGFFQAKLLFQLKGRSLQPLDRRGCDIGRRSERHCQFGYDIIGIDPGEKSKFDETASDQADCYNKNGNKARQGDIAQLQAQSQAGPVGFVDKSLEQIIEF